MPEDGSHGTRMGRRAPEMDKRDKEEVAGISVLLEQSNVSGGAKVAEGEHVADCRTDSILVVVGSVETGHARQRSRIDAREEAAEGWGSRLRCGHGVVNEDMHTVHTG